MKFSMTRRDVFKLMAGTGAALMLPPLKFMAAERKHMDVLNGERLYDHVVQYAQIGEHRTGTTGDMLTAEWIKREFESYGLETAFHPVAMNLFEVTSGFLETGHRRFRADPEWYPTPTPNEGITAPMKVLQDGEDLSALRGKLWVVPVKMEIPVVPREFKDRALAAAKAGAVGVVMLLTFRSEELTGRGAHGDYGQQPWCPVPLVGVAAKHDAVLEAAGRGETARLVVLGREKKNHHAVNVTGSLGTGDKTVVVTTPQSGLFRCGGERAGGLAILLGLAEWVGKRKPNVRYLFSTNTGHEQDGSGAELLLAKAVPPPEQVAGWVHLGSGIATWDWRRRDDGTFERFARKSGVRNLGAVPELFPLLTRAFEPIPGLTPQSDPVYGELRRYIRDGYRAFGFWGYNHYGHTVADGPEQSAPELLEPFSHCVANALEEIERAYG